MARMLVGLVGPPGRLWTRAREWKAVKIRRKLVLRMRTFLV